MKAHVVVLSLALASPAGAQTFGDDYSANHWLPACKDYMTIATGDQRSVQTSMLGSVVPQTQTSAADMYGV